MLKYGLVAVGFAILGVAYSIRGPTGFWWMLLIVLFVYIIKCRQSLRNTLLIALTSFGFYFSIGMLAEHTNETVYDAGRQTLAGSVASIPVIDGDTVSLTLQTGDGERIRLQSYLSSEAEKAEWYNIQPGDRCQVKGELQPPSSPTNFYQFDYQQYLREQTIHWQLITPELQCKRAEKSIMNQIQSWRQLQMQQLEQTVDAKLAGIIIALVFGERAYMDGDLLNAYQRFGIIHLLAVSGLHVGIMTAALFYLFIRAGITRERAQEILIAFLPLYAVIAGGAPSVIRAVGMAMLVLLCLRLKQRIPPLAGIYLVFLVYLALQPYALFHLGFQLSFLISFGLIVSATTIQARYSSYIGQLTAVTLIAQLLSAPIILLHTYEWSWFSIPLNLLYVPFIALFVLPSSLLSFLFQLMLPDLTNLPLKLLTLTVPSAHQALIALEQHPSFIMIIGKPSPIIVGLLYTAIGFGLFC